MKLTLNLLLLLLLGLPITVNAELPSQVEQDFSVISGYVVMSVSDEYVVDLDDRDHLNEGDILTVVAPGKKIYHPVTQEVIGSVDVPLGFLQVTRIYSGYSYAKPITEGLVPKNGAPLRRFEQVPARFVDHKGDGGMLADQLMMNLPQLKWLDEGKNNQALVTFMLTENALEVTFGEGTSLHRYEVTEDQQVIAPAAAAPRPFVATRTKPKGGLLQQTANSLLTSLNIEDENYFEEMDAAIVRQKSGKLKGVWIGPNIDGSPSGVAVADLDKDGSLETAIVLDNKLLIARIRGEEYEQLAELTLPSRGQILSIDALDLNGDGEVALYLSAVSGFEPVSFVVEFRSGSYEVVIDNIRWFLRAVEFPGSTGRVLIGQMMSRGEQPFTGKIFRVERKGNTLIKGEDLNLPDQLNVFSFVPFVDSQGKTNYAHLTMGDYLKVIDSDGTDLWESADYFGGSESCFVNRAELKNDLLSPTCMRPRIVKTPEDEFLIVQNDGQRILERYKKFKKSRIVSLSWNGFVMGENWRTASQLGYLADFSLADADNDGNVELVLAILFKHEGVTAPARSSLVTYDLK